MVKNYSNILLSFQSGQLWLGGLNFSPPLVGYPKRGCGPGWNLSNLSSCSCTRHKHKINNNKNYHQKNLLASVFQFCQGLWFQVLCQCYPQCWGYLCHLLWWSLQGKNTHHVNDEKDILQAHFVQLVKHDHLALLDNFQSSKV